MLYRAFYSMWGFLNILVHITIIYFISLIGHEKARLKQVYSKCLLKKSMQYKHNELKIQGETLKLCCFNKQK